MLFFSALKMFSKPYVVRLLQLQKRLKKYFEMDVLFL